MSNSKMKIGIITFHAAVNYGAVLQAYALVSFLKGLGHSPKMIDYRPTPVLSGEFEPRFKLFGLHPADYLNRTRQQSFRKFRRDHLPMTDRTFLTEEELNQADEFDAYICGSDQIWNPTLIDGHIDPAYFLSFASPSKRKIAYAASTGGKAFLGENLEPVGKLLHRLDYISVREKSLLEPVSTLSGKSAVQVLDPTLLPVDYSNLIASDSEKYILLYPLQTSKNLYEKALQLSRITGLPIRNLGTKVNPRKHPGKLINGSPEDFVSLFSRASYVVTNSFHGTVFSTIFQRPLISCGLEGEFAVRNVRMVDYLESVGLSDRFYNSERILEQNVVDRMRAINWKEVEAGKVRLQTTSIAFLKEALG